MSEKDKGKGKEKEVQSYPPPLLDENGNPRPRKTVPAGQQWYQRTQEQRDKKRQDALEKKRKLMQAERLKLDQKRPEWDLGLNETNPLTSAQESALQRVWYTEGAAWGRDRLFQTMRAQDVQPISRRQIYSWVRKQEAYQRYKSFDPDTNILKTIQPTKPGIVQADYLFFSKQKAGKNKQYQKIFVAIDIFTHYAWAYLAEPNAIFDDDDEFQDVRITDVKKRAGVDYFRVFVGNEDKGDWTEADLVAEESVGQDGFEELLEEMIQGGGKLRKYALKRRGGDDEEYAKVRSQAPVTMRVAILHAKKMIRDANNLARDPDLGKNKWRVRVVWTDKGQEFTGIDPDREREAVAPEDMPELEPETVASDTRFTKAVENTIDEAHPSGRGDIPKDERGRHMINPTRTHSHHVERFNRTLRMLLSKKLEVESAKTKVQPQDRGKLSEGQNKKRELEQDVLDAVVEMYNNNPHPSIRMPPMAALDPDNWDKARIALGLMTKQAKKLRAPEFEPNDLVRVGIRKLAAGQKADRPQYTRQLYVVAKVIKGEYSADTMVGKTPKIMYRVRELQKEEIRGTPQRKDDYYLPDPIEKSEDKSIGAFFRQIPKTPLFEGALVNANYVYDKQGEKLYKHILSDTAVAWHKEHMEKKMAAEADRQQKARNENRAAMRQRLAKRQRQIANARDVPLLQ